MTYVVCELNTKYAQYFMPEKMISVAAHELGHALGLADTSTNDSLMNRTTSVRYGTYGIYYPQTDDINGANYLY